MILFWKTMLINQAKRAGLHLAPQSESCFLKQNELEMSLKRALFELLCLLCLLQANLNCARSSRFAECRAARALVAGSLQRAGHLKSD